MKKKYNLQQVSISTDALAQVVKGLTPDEKEIILDGCLMNYYKNHSEN